MPPTSKSELQNKEELQKERTKDEAKARYQKAAKSNKITYLLVPLVASITFGIHQILPTWFGGRPRPSFQATSAALQECLNNVCGGKDCVRYPGDRGQWARPYNEALVVIPAAVVRPKSPEDISAIVKCAIKYNVKVQAKSGGHSYANHGLGGNDGSISIDLQVPDFQYVYLNNVTGQATIGSGSRLLEIDKELHDLGKRTFPHGICPGVGIGGHATVGGLGPMSRMWGTCLDHVDEVQVVIANGSIVRASLNENEDLFFALRGAGAGFGIITEFVMKTYAELDQVVHFTRSFSYKNMSEIAGQFHAWQTIIADKKLDNRFGTEFWLNADKAEVRSTFYGSKDEFKKSGILELISQSDYHLLDEDSAENDLEQATWRKTYEWQTGNLKMYFSDTPTEFYSRSFGFTKENLLPSAAIKEVFESIYNNGKKSGALKWFVIFDATGGEVSRDDRDPTAFAHRDKVMFYQSYALNAFKLSDKVPHFLNKTHEAILSHLPEGFQYSTYPGYVDPALVNAQQAYWGSNLPRLEQIKAKWDPTDVFHNPQSVLPRSEAKSG